MRGKALLGKLSSVRPGVVTILVFLAHQNKCTGRYCHPDVGVGNTLWNFTTRLFYVTGKALSGKLSCMWTGLVCFSSFQTCSYTMSL